jgi:hypothetical protein
MSLLKKAAGFFFETEEKPTPKPVEKEVQKAAMPTYTTPIPAPSNPSTVTEFKKHFENVLKENNLPGNDFYEFKLMKDGMNAIPDEGQRYVIAFSGLQATGLNKATLLETANKYVAIVEAEMHNFDSAYEQQYKTSVTDVDIAINEKTAKMNELAQQINSLNKDISELKQKSMESTQSLQDKKNGFVMAAMNQKNELLSEIAKIQQYIQ